VPCLWVRMRRRLQLRPLQHEARLSVTVTVPRAVRLGTQRKVVRRRSSAPVPALALAAIAIAKTHGQLSGLRVCL
jgi:hypothetical protein